MPKRKIKVPRIKFTKRGRRYIMIEGKRVFIDKSVTQNQLVMFLIKKLLPNASKKEKEDVRKVVAPAVAGDTALLDRAQKEQDIREKNTLRDQRERERLQKEKEEKHRRELEKIDKLLEFRQAFPMLHPSRESHFSPASPRPRVELLEDPATIDRNIERLEKQTDAAETKVERIDENIINGVKVEIDKYEHVKIEIAKLEQQLAELEHQKILLAEKEGKSTAEKNVLRTLPARIGKLRKKIQTLKDSTDDALMAEREKLAAEETKKEDEIKAERLKRINEARKRQLDRKHEEEATSRISDLIHNATSSPVALRGNPRRRLSHLGPPIRIDAAVAHEKEKNMDDLDTDNDDDDDDQSASGLKIGKDGMTNSQIDEIMHKYPEFLGTIASDEIGNILPKVKPKSRGCFVMNLDKSTQPGSHWVSVFYDARPGGSMSIEYYDSFAREPSASFMKDMQLLANALDSESYLKFKINKIVQQDEDSVNCGPFAMRFLIDRLRGKPFSESSGYDDHVKQEKDIEKWKQAHDISPFGYLIKNGSGIVDTAVKGLRKGADFVNSVVHGRKHYPPAMRKILEKYGGEKILHMSVGRAPLKTIQKLGDLVTDGAVSDYLKSKAYDNFYHLFMNITLDSGKKLTLEKNHVLRLASGTKKGEDNMDVAGGGMTLNDLIEKTRNKIGIEHMIRYSSDNWNCQDFILNVLKANGLLTDGLEKFILQDVSSLYKKIPAVVPIIQGATDLAGKLDVIKNGVGLNNIQPVRPTVAVLLSNASKPRT